MVAEALDIARETYLAILLDRAYGGAVLMGSPMGGVDIEEVAEKHPDQIFTVSEGRLRFFIIRISFLVSN
jgi:succinyl-CoA synthetase beta subunit